MTGTVYQPLAPFGAGGVSAPLTVGGVASSDWTIRSAMMNPDPQSVAGVAVAQAWALVGSVMRVLTWLAVRLGAAERISVAIPAALGVAALVPKNVASAGTVVDTPSAAASAGLGLTTGAMGTPAGVNNRVIDGPRELNTSGVVGVDQLEAATAIEPAAEAASGLMALEFVGNWLTVKVETPPAMYFMNGVPAPAFLWIPIATECDPDKAMLLDLDREATDVAGVGRGDRVAVDVPVERQVGRGGAPRLCPLERDERCHHR